jgi:Hsp70 protein
MLLHPYRRSFLRRLLAVLLLTITTTITTTTILIITTTTTITTTQARAILGVDLGSLYMKVALVQSGHPIEIVTNLHSKRKTEQMILFDNLLERGYGADAAALLQRKAHWTPTAMSLALGRTHEHPAVRVSGRYVFVLMLCVLECWFADLLVGWLVCVCVSHI